MATDDVARVKVTLTVEIEMRSTWGLNSTANQIRTDAQNGALKIIKDALETVPDGYKARTVPGTTKVDMIVAGINGAN